jgi:uncharacterized protein involved in outer membrane biogenesis
MLRRILIGLAILLTAAVLAVVLVDWQGMARDAVVRALEARTGRAVALERIRLHAQLPLRIELIGLSIANPQWAEHQPLLGVQSADFTVRLLPLLRREVVLPQVALVRPEANLEQREGERSWVFDRQPRPDDAATAPALPEVQALSIADATVRYADAQSKTAITIQGSQSASSGQRAGFEFRASGRYKDEPIEIDGRGASLLSLADQGTPYPVKLDAKVGKTAASFDGQVVNPAKLTRVTGDFVIQGDNLERLYRIAGVTLPASPPYRLRGHLTRDGSLWRLESFVGGIGDSDLSGDVSYDAAQKPPLLRAQLRSKLLDLDDLGPLIGAPPKTGPGETASAQQKQQARALARKREVVPEREFKTERWGRLNAQVALDAARIRREKWLPIDDLSVRMTLKDRVIDLAPLRFGVASGNVDSTVRLDGNQSPLAVRAATRFRNLQLARLVPKLQSGPNSTGRLFGDAQLAARGASVKAMTESLDGQLHLTMGPGSMSNILLEALGLDAAEVVELFATGDKVIQVRCMVGNFDVTDGVARATALVIATGDTNVMGTGNVYLAREQLDLTVYAAPKDMSPLSFRAPLHVRGTFKDPQVRPDAGVLAAKGAAAVVLGLINPVLALVPLIETGPGTDSSCGELIAQAKGWREAKDPAARSVRQDEEKKRAAQGDTAAGPVPDTPRAEDVTRKTPGATGPSNAGGQRANGDQPDAKTGPQGGRREEAPRAEDILKRQDGS